MDMCLVTVFVWPSKVLVLSGAVSMKGSLCVHRLITQSALSTLNSVVVFTPIIPPSVSLVIHVIAGMFVCFA